MRPVRESLQLLLLLVQTNSLNKNLEVEGFHEMTAIFPRRFNMKSGDFKRNLIKARTYSIPLLLSSSFIV